MITDFNKFLKIYESGKTNSINESNDSVDDILLLKFLKTEEVYLNTDKQYEVLKKLDEASFNAYVLLLENNGILLEYNSISDTYNVTCPFNELEDNNLTESDILALEGIHYYDNDSNEYQYLFSLEENVYNDFITKAKENGTNISYDAIDDEYIIEKN